MPKPLVIQFTPIKTCLVNLPGKWVNALLDQKKVHAYNPTTCIVKLTFPESYHKMSYSKYPLMPKSFIVAGPVIHQGLYNLIVFLDLMQN